MSPSGQWSSTPRATQYWALAAGSPPTRIRIANGTSACTRPRPSLIGPAPLDENPGQSFRLADHQVVTGIHRDHGVHAAKGGDAVALGLDRQRAIASGQDPRPAYVVGHVAPGHVFGCYT